VGGPAPSGALTRARGVRIESASHLVRALRAAALAVGVLGGLSAARAAPAPPLLLTFEPYGVFFSRAAHQPIPIDPQVFQRAVGSVSGAGPQDIVHAPGVQPALLDAPPATPLYAADERPLGITLRAWLAARGTARVEARDPGPRVTASFTGLVPGGTYSLFRRLGAARERLAPLDGLGTSNTFDANSQGGGRAVVLASAPLLHGHGVVLVFHSDRQAHEMLPGAPGLTAHDQLIAVVP
jgi:hypothetical protein